MMKAFARTPARRSSCRYSAIVWPWSPLEIKSLILQWTVEIDSVEARVDVKRRFRRYRGDIDFDFGHFNFMYRRVEAPHCKLVLLKIATVYPLVDFYHLALYYWLRTYLFERQDVANKSELGRLAMAQQRMQQNVSGSGSLGISDGNARVQSHSGSTLTRDNLVHQGPQSSSGIRSHSGGNSHGREPERSTGTTVESSVHAGNDQPLQQNSSTINESGQNALRRGRLGFVASAASACDVAKDIIEALRSKHANLASELDDCHTRFRSAIKILVYVMLVLLTEIGSRFVTLPEERLLAVVNALHHRWYKYPTATTEEVPQSLKKELSGVCRAWFSADAVSKHVDFVREYKQDFEREYKQDFEHIWIQKSIVEDTFAAILKLEEESRVLRDFNVVDVEVPGQYFSTQEIEPAHTVKLDRVGADILIVRRHGSSFQRLTLIGSDGLLRHFIVQTSLTQPMPEVMNAYCSFSVL
ncbi:hypothetical protein GH714_015807 [Hevea brasiliensis]|uniref:Uncharacterized protein n=1 Tax=Hevea brasiliensis TaxID=3981 RepID=A0A6A6KTT4_HEVBR|nr:hypothetical protein GH714_015807 [Hevea brasiliensis]